MRRGERAHDRWWRKAYAATRIERYYANHEESKRIGAQRAKERYASLEKGSSEYIKRLLRARIWKAVKMYSRSDIKPRKHGRTLDLVGCSAPALRNHLESKFTEGMGWHNQGDWHIDHIVPCCSFDLSDPYQQRACFHFTNLQPLWARDNISKGGRCASA